MKNTSSHLTLRSWRIHQLRIGGREVGALKIGLPLFDPFDRMTNGKYGYARTGLTRKNPALGSAGTLCAQFEARPARPDFSQRDRSRRPSGWAAGPYRAKLRVSRAGAVAPESSFETLL